jgi:acyl-CoA synthetase (AMP-forming)/AMP-acid ligase II
MKLDIMDFFPKAQLFEAYGSTEAGLVTLLRPEDQMKKLGSIGREVVGTDLIRLLGENEDEVPVGEVGELFSRGPMMFDYYWKLPEKTKNSFRGEYFSAGDLARKDKDGYFYIVDRKDNMIITGGEHVYPSEVEEVLCNHPAVFDAAVIGLPHEKWGEAVTAIIVLKEGKTATKEELIALAAKQLAGFKKPKNVIFISNEEMPKTASGKILHKKLRDKFGGGTTATQG